LNFGFDTFSPLNIRSAPTFLPSLGQPYFGPNRLCIHPQEEKPIDKIIRRIRKETPFGRLYWYGGFGFMDM
jgi:hypothetical protein